jgi:O-antigen/teichoic acid export membrane protein
MKSSLAKGAAYLSLSSIVFMASGYLINVWLGKTLGPESYGVYGIVITLMSLINIMQTAGLPQAVSRFIAGKDDTPHNILSTAIRVQVLSTTFLTLIYIIVAFPLSALLKDKDLLPYLILSAAVLPFYGLFSVYMGYYNGQHFFRRQALMNNVYSIAKLVFVFLLTIKFKLYGAIAGFIIAPLAALSFGVQDIPSLKSNYPWKKLFNFSVPLVGFAITSTAMLSIGLFILKGVTGSNIQAGYYVAAQNIAMLPYYALNAISLVLLPGIAALNGKENYEKTQKLVKQSLRYTLLVLIPASIMLAASSKTIISILFSSQYTPGYTALQILILAYGLLTIFTMFASILSGSGHPGTSLKTSIMGLVATIAFCAALIPRYGIEGAAWGTTIGALVAVIISFVYIRRFYNVVFPYITFLRSLFCSIIASIPAFYLNRPAIVLSVGYLLSFVAYIFTLILTKEFTVSDIMKLRGFLSEKIPNRNTP